MPGSVTGENSSPRRGPTRGQHWGACTAPSRPGDWIDPVIIKPSVCSPALPEAPAWGSWAQAHSWLRLPPARPSAGDADPLIAPEEDVVIHLESECLRELHSGCVHGHGRAGAGASEPKAPQGGRQVRQDRHWAPFERLEGRLQIATGLESGWRRRGMRRRRERPAPAAKRCGSLARASHPLSNPDGPLDLQNTALRLGCRRQPKHRPFRAHAAPRRRVTCRLSRRRRIACFVPHQRGAQNCWPAMSGVLEGGVYCRCVLVGGCAAPRRRLRFGLPTRAQGRSTEQRWQSDERLSVRCMTFPFLPGKPA